MVTEREAYRLLGLAPDATSAEVRAAFRRKVREQHPDTALAGTDESSVQELVDAYHRLVGSGSGREAGSGGTSDTGPRRIRVRHRHDDDPKEPRHVERRCPACAGRGRRVQEITCPDCRGSARFTSLDMDRARVSSCRTCGGRGQRRVHESCEVCGGQGTVRSAVD